MAITLWVPPGPAASTARLAQCPRCATKWYDTAGAAAQACTVCGGTVGGGAWILVAAS